MLRAPSNRRKKKGYVRPNLIPILDAVFIFIFFLLLSASFVKVFEIDSNIPIVSAKAPKKEKNKKPLALNLRINDANLVLYRGVPSRRVKTFKKIGRQYDLERLHNYLVGLKKRYPKEKTIIVEPLFNVEYGTLVDIMDAVRMFRETDEKVTVQEDGVDIFVEDLFSDIVFGNIQS